MEVSDKTMKKTPISRITLGTVQFGLDYGIANKSGKPTKSKSLEILNFAVQHGINMFDTAPAYGNSEKIIGEFIERLKSEGSDEIPQIITKLSNIEITDHGQLYEKIKTSVQKSIENLNISCIPFLLLHNPKDLHRLNGEIIKSLLKLKEEGLVRKIGVSVYTPEEVMNCLLFDNLDAIQIPINILDQRLIKTGLLKKLHEKNIFIFARSIFLQGLVFLDPEELPENLVMARKPLRDLNRISKKQNLTVAELSFCYIRDMPEISSIVMGVDNLAQLKENIEHLSLPALPSEIKKEISICFSNIPEKIINPTKWH